MNAAIVLAAMLIELGPVDAVDDQCPAGLVRVVQVRLDIDDMGKPTDCHVEKSSGNAALDETTCKISLKRVRFKPARDENRRPIASTYSYPIRWVCGKPAKKPE